MTDSPPLILVADPDGDLREQYTLYLGLAGYRTAQASEGFRAIGIIEEFHPDLLVADLALPWLDAFGLARLLAEGQDHPLIPIIGTTALNGPVLTGRVVAAGIRSLLPRLCRLEDLLHEVRYVLRQSRTLKITSARLRDASAAARQKSGELRRRSAILQAKFDRLQLRAKAV